jgi:hypothetical protein
MLKHALLTALVGAVLMVPLAAAPASPAHDRTAGTTVTRAHAPRTGHRTRRHARRLRHARKQVRRSARHATHRTRRG